MTQQQRPHNCMCCGNCSTCKCNQTTPTEETAVRRYFGDGPDDLEERTNNFLDSQKSK